MSDCFCTNNYQCLACERAEKQIPIITLHKRKTIRKEAVCGTRAGYNKHRRLGEETCAECREAQKIAVQRYQRLAANQ